MTTPFKIHPDAEITDKQRNLIAKLADERDWSSAPTSVSLIIRRVRHAIRDDVPCTVKRQAASSAIDYLLKPLMAPPLATVTVSTSTISKWEILTKLLANLPISKYAVWSKQTNQWEFIEIREQKSTKKRYLNKLLGAPGHWAWAHGITIDWMILMAEIIAKDPTKFAVNYCEQFTRCSACDSPLSNAKSIAEAMGPTCRKKFKWN